MDLLPEGACPLFRGIAPEELGPLLDSLGAQARSFAKGETIYRAGEAVTCLGVVLSGSVLIQSIDLWGSAAVLDRVAPGQIFAETYACTPGEPLMVHVSAAQDARVLFLDVSRILPGGPQACPCRARLVSNLLALSAQKNLTLSRKILHTAPRTIRGRLLSYLSQQALRAGSPSFTIPFDRQQLADYLNVERSALSHELSKMRREGLLVTRRSHFRLLGPLEPFPD